MRGQSSETDPRLIQDSSVTAALKSGPLPVVLGKPDTHSGPGSQHPATPKDERQKASRSKKINIWIWKENKASVKIV